MYDPETCQKQDTCTNCPVRKNCIIRELFYYPEQFAEIISMTNAEILGLNLDRGIPLESILIGIEQCQTEMYKRRAEELKLHPTFSVD